MDIKKIIILLLIISVIKIKWKSLKSLKINYFKTYKKNYYIINIMNTNIFKRIT